MQFVDLKQNSSMYLIFDQNSNDSFDIEIFNKKKGKVDIIIEPVTTISKTNYNNDGLLEVIKKMIPDPKFRYNYNWTTMVEGIY